MSTFEPKDRERAHALAGIGAEFLRRVHLTGVVLSLFVSLATAVYLGPNWGLGFLACSIWSVLNLWALESLVRHTFRPGGARLSVIAVGLLVKMPLLYGALIALLYFTNFPAASILFGLSLPLFVIVMKIAGQVVASRLGGPAAGARTVNPS